MPILMRKAMKYLSPVELRVLVYLQTRCSRFMICYPTLEEIAHDLDLAGRRNLTPHIKAPIAITARVVHTHLDSSQNLYAGVAFDFAFNPSHRDFVVDQVTRYVSRVQASARKAA